MSTYKEMDRGRRETPVSSCPTGIGELFYGDCPAADNEGGRHGIMAYHEMNAFEKVPVSGEKPERLVRSRRISTIRETYPGCSFAFARVDTENRFDYGGFSYQIDPSVEAYLPKQTEEGSLFDMDEIVIVVHGRGLTFYAQDCSPIEPDKIRKL